MSENSNTSLLQITNEGGEVKKEKNVLSNDEEANDFKTKILSTDELTSLEQEIAKIHRADEFSSLDQVNQSDYGNVNDKDNTENDHSVDDANNKMKHSTVTSENGNMKIDVNKTSNLHEVANIPTPSTIPLEPYDLIAVLKGLDSSPQKQVQSNPMNKELSIKTKITPDNEKINKIDTSCGVTIEGEGEYPIMEVVYDDVSMPENGTIEPETSPAPRPPNVLRKRNTTAALLTVEAERALALEQIACLKTERNKRRKQDFKSVQSNNIELSSSPLVVDWSDDEMLQNDAISKADRCQTNQGDTDNINNNNESKVKSSPEITSVLIIPSSILPAPSGVDSLQDNCIVSENVKTKENVASKEPKVKVEEPNQQTGFRRTRVIKKKIIWDPDAPETTFSFAQLIKPNSNRNQTTTTKTTKQMIKTAQMVLNKGTATINVKKSKTAVVPRKIKQVTSKDTKKSVTTENSIIGKHANAETCMENKQTMARSNYKNNIIREEVDKREERSATLTKKRSNTPITNGGRSSASKKKKLTEVESLMSDEGAINMLNSLEPERSSFTEDGNKATRPMMRSRAATICGKKESSVTKTTSSLNRCETPITLNPSNRTVAAKTKRAPKSKASASWDYVYNKQRDIDDSMIIRRRSNSSYSSNTSMHRLSLDATPLVAATPSRAGSSKASSVKSFKKSNINSGNNTKALIGTGDSTNKRNSAKLKSTGSENQMRSSKSTLTNDCYVFEFAKPESKSDKRNNKTGKSPALAVTLANDLKVTTPHNKRNASSPRTVDTNNISHQLKNVKINSVNERNKESTNIIASGPVPVVAIKKSAKVAEISFNTSRAKLNNTFTMQVMNKLVDALNRLNKDNDCHVVVIHSVNSIFCQGIDITDLAIRSLKTRKCVANVLGLTVKNYLKALIRFSKPLVAAVNGNNINFGVTQLALFDVVVAGDTSSFETSFTKLGQLPEGYCIWNNMPHLSRCCATKLFWLNEKLLSSEAALFGLVTKCIVPSKVTEEALNIAHKIADMPQESYRIMKRLALQKDMESIMTKLDDEFEIIINRWTTSDSCDRIKQYIEFDHV